MEPLDVLFFVLFSHVLHGVDELWKQWEKELKANGAFQQYGNLSSNRKNLKEVKKNFEKWDDKELYFSLAFVSLLIALIIGFKYDDPFISTASAVAIPFSIFALIWPNHIRHLHRLRFYPIFIFAMFLCVRVPWFIIPLIILFIAIRIINYFRYGIVYPSFGVDFDEDISTSIR